MAQSPFTPQTVFPNTAKQERLTSKVGSTDYQVVTTLNNLLNALNVLMAALGGSAPITTSTLSIGTTVTLALSASQISINGVIAAVAAQTGQALGALGTIPASKWGLIVAERVAAGTTTFTSAAANYTVGYASEALAIAAMPAQSANKAVVGYITVLASASTWVCGTDALATGTGGNPATTTNYYSIAGAADTATWTNVKQIANSAGTVLTS